MAEIDARVPQKLIKVRRLEAHDVASYRELRLEGLKSHPEAFASAWEDQERRALKVGNEYYDEVLMALTLREPTVPEMK